MSDFLVAVWITPMYEHIKRKKPVVDLPYLSYLPVIAQLSSELNSHVIKFMKTVETSGEFYCDDYLTHEQASDDYDVPARLANTLRLSYLFNNNNSTNSDKLYTTLRSLWNSKIFLAFSVRIDDTRHIASLFRRCIHFLTNKIMSPPTTTTPSSGGGGGGGGNKQYKSTTADRDNVFGQFVVSLKDFCLDTWKETANSSEFMLLDIDVIYKMHRDYMDASLEKKRILYTNLRKIGFNHASAGLLKFIHRNAHLDRMNANLLKRLTVEFQCNDTYLFIEKLCHSDNKYAHECFRSSVEDHHRLYFQYHRDDDDDDNEDEDSLLSSDTPNISMEDIRDGLILFFESLTKLVVKSGILSDEKKEEHHKCVMDYLSIKYHNLCAMFVIIFDDFHQTVKFQTMLVSCLLDYIMPVSGSSIYRCHTDIIRFVGYLEKYNYDPEKMNDRISMYRKLLVDLKPEGVQHATTPENYYSVKKKLSYPFEISELPQLPESITNILLLPPPVSSSSSSSVDKIKIKKIYEPSEIGRIWLMSLEDFCLYIGNPTAFTVKKNILRKKYATILLRNLKIPNKEKHDTTINRLHIILILMTQFHRRVGKPSISFHDDRARKEMIDTLFNTMLRRFLGIIGDKLLLSPSDTCPYCFNTYRDCLSPLVIIAEDFILEEMTMKMVALIIKWAPQYRETGKIYTNDNERVKESEREKDVLDEMSKELFGFTMNGDEKYSFL